MVGGVEFCGGMVDLVEVKKIMRDGKFCKWGDFVIFLRWGFGVEVGFAKKGDVFLFDLKGLFLAFFLL